MVLVVCQIQAQLQVLKNWYGCSLAEQVTLIDLYNQYASGQFEMVMVSPDVAVG